MRQMCYQDFVSLLCVSQVSCCPTAFLLCIMQRQFQPEGGQAGLDSRLTILVGLLAACRRALDSEYSPAERQALSGPASLLLLRAPTDAAGGRNTMRRHVSSHIWH